jgi:hypothetical protein|tara:strand:+ start:9068 stop:9292 length:225 start_codon:yes stop_codon:yes gene_type:complete
MTKWEYIEGVCATQPKAKRKDVLWKRYRRAKDQDFKAFLRALRRGYGFHENGQWPEACDQFLKAYNIRKRYIKE